METILVPTDFSPAANNAAYYALHMARVMETGIKLCNAMKVPAETAHAGHVAWPLADHSDVQHETSAGLRSLTEQLRLAEQTLNGASTFHPKISGISKVGEVTAVIKQVVGDQKMSLVVMGMSGAGTLERLFLGSNSRDLIDEAPVPVLLIPAIATFKGIKKIAFSTDLSRKDITVIASLSTLAAHFNAELLIAHITDDTYDSTNHQRRVDAFLTEVSGKADYPRIYYRHVKSLDVDRGLHWLTDHGQIDMMAMIHRPLPFLTRLIKGSHTQKLAKHIQIPLLVFPPDCQVAM